MGWGAIIGIVIFVILVVGIGTHDNIGAQRIQPICEELAPGWALQEYVSGTDSFGNGTTCFYWNGVDSRDNNSLRIRYYLIDYNHLGREIR